MASTRDQDIARRLTDAAVEHDGKRYIRAGKAARIIGCPLNMQGAWSKSGRLNPIRARVKPTQQTPSGWVCYWPLEQAIDCGLTYRTVARPWTSDEEDQLVELLGTRPIKEVADALERSVGAVRQRGYQLGVREADAQGLMTLGVVAQLCGCSRATVRSWCDPERTSPVLRHSRLPNSRRQFMVSADALVAFFRQHPARFERLSTAAQRRVERATMPLHQRRKAVAA